MKNTLIKTDDLKKYLSGALESELNLYIQRKTINNMEQRYNSLARYKKLNKPVLDESNIFDDIVGGMLITAPVCAVLAGILGFIINFDDGFFGLIATVFMTIVYGIIGFIAGGLIIGAIIGIIMHSREKKRYKSIYETEMAKHNTDIKNDNIRVKREQAQKEALGKEINAMKACYNKTQRHLNEIYSFGIIAPDYRNIYAVSSIYGYIEKGRTRGLEFNENTGDQGAYNIYEYERRLDMIITNTEEILSRLDEAISNQYTLAMGLQQANAKIDTLCGNINSHMNRISGSLNSIERCQSIVAYNTERAANELAFMNWMHFIGY